MTMASVSPQSSGSWFDPMRLALVAVGISVVVICFRRRSADSASFRTANAPDNVVLLHQLGHGPYCPSLSPFVLKVETFLRVNNIPYKSVYDRKMGPKGKTPWIEFNGDVIPDSSFIVSYLNEKFNVSMDASLTSYERGVARALQRLAEEHLYFQLGLWRAVHDPEKEMFKAVGLKWLYIWMLERKARTDAWHQGLGRHSEEDLAAITEADLAALSAVLGEKDYFLGAQPSEVDCSLFGQLSQWVWQAPRSPGHRLIIEKFPNLKRFCERVKEKYWSDWDELILLPSTQ
ncbi:failed axon connections homolog [Babylonia areolata]|uniref:failed axon connections homolog n=1 Tax=Babylonia areolata TaxID=304850 RepID=UPI003FD45EB8